MNKHPILMTCAWVFFGWFAVVPAGVSAEPDEPVDLVAPESPEGVRIRYAEVNLELAAIELQMMLEANEKMPMTIGKEVIDRKKANIRVAKELLRVARKWQENGDAVEVHLIRAQEDAELAKRNYLRALETRNRELVYTDLQLKQLRLTAELTQLRLAMWSDPQHTMSLIHHMHWQIERLSEEVLDLQKKLGELSDKSDQL